MKDIIIGNEYGYWVYLGTDINNFANCDLVAGKCIIKGKKKVAVFIEVWNQVKWKYPRELTNVNCTNTLVSGSVCLKCGDTGRCEPRTLSDPDGQECDCKHFC